MVQDPRLPTQGQVIAGKYEVVRVLGSGGMGIVYEALHRRLEQRVAIKVLKPHHMENRKDVARFEREARAAARIKGQYVARILDVETTESGLPFIVMEMLEGNDLWNEIRGRPPPPVAQIVDWMLEVCVAMDEAHAMGIVHRDLKPSNIFLSPVRGGGRSVRVLDFGISKVLGSLDSTATSRGAVGTPKYMSPEQVGGKDVDGRTDVWAIGIVLYRVLSGEFPFEGDGYSTFALILESEPVSLGQRRPDLPAALVDVVMRALAKAPAARHQTVGALAEKLRPFGSGRVPLPVFKSGATTARIPVDVVDAADMRRSDVDPSIPSLSRPSGATPRGRGSRVAIGALVIGGIAAVGLGIGALVGRAHRTDAPAGAGPSSAAAPPAREVAGEPPSGPGAPSSAPAATVSAAPSASPPAAQAISSAPSAVVAPRTAAPHASGRPAASAPAGTAGRPTAAPSGATKPPASAAPPPRPSASGGEIPLYL